MDVAETSSLKSRKILSFCRGRPSGTKSSCGLFRWVHCSQIDLSVSVIAELFQHGSFRGSFHFNLEKPIERATLEKEITRLLIFQVAIESVGAQSSGR